MTLVVLALSWIALAILVRPPRTLLSTLGPRVQALVGLLASISFISLPTAAAAVVLARALSESGGATLRGCGRLIWAIVGQPLARPELSIALAVLAIVPIALARGVISAWGSQSASRELARRGRGALVVVPTQLPMAFTAGLLRPTVVVSRGLLTTASAPHREVVLAHEEAHRVGRHPLLLFIAEAMARAVPIAPLRWASATLRFGLESLADDRAAFVADGRDVVAEAIAGLALATAGTAAAFEGDEVRRVRRLLEPTRATPLRGTAVAALLFGVLLFSGGHGVHCAADSMHLLTTAQCRLD